MNINANSPPKCCSCFFIFLILSGIISLCGCTASYQNIEHANINETFEEDYIKLEQVADYLLTIEHDIITIRNNYDYVLGDFGEKITIDNTTVKDTINDLFRNGYLLITKNDSTVKFERWKKTLSHEFRAGFAYDENDAEELNIQYVIECQELSKCNWYYVELDYNEWRKNN